VQFGIHFVAILVATEVALSFVDPYDPSMIPDGPFNPNTLNTCTFLMSVLSTVNTFAVNYRGEPFMEPLQKNKLLVRSLQLCYGVLLICALEIFPPLNDLMQLAEFPDTTESAEWNNDVESSSVEQQGGLILGMLNQLVKSTGFPVFMCGLMIVDTVLAFASERIILRIFR
jgi:cation-transporting ATPase 13A1